jgi:hypothetical protein
VESFVPASILFASFVMSGELSSRSILRFWVASDLV